MPCMPFFTCHAHRIAISKTWGSYQCNLQAVQAEPNSVQFEVQLQTLLTVSTFHSDGYEK